jgi:penicillin-binding protein 1A
MYLNTVEFSDNAFGIKSAARTYFNKLPVDLLPEESAVLVGMLQAPSRYNPRINPENSVTRRNTVLGQMKKYKFDSLKQKPLVLDYKSSNHISGLAPYFREYLRLNLQRWCRDNKKVDGSNYDIYKDGLKVYVTIDSRMQKHAEEAMNQHMKELQKKFFEHWKEKDPWKEFPDELTRVMKLTDRYKSLKANNTSQKDIDAVMRKKIKMKVFSWNGIRDTIMSPLDSLKYHRMFIQNGFLAADPKTGEILAWVGGINYEYFKYDHTTALRQIGSTFKPFLYATAIDNGWSPCYEIYDLPVSFEDFNNWTPQNADGKFTGEKMNLKKCLALSQNSCSAFLMKQIGPQPVIDMVKRLGITSHIDPYPSICLGTPDISLQEMVGAYTAFANQGVYSKPHFITRIVDKNGNLIQEFPSEKIEILNEQTAYAMVELLRNVTVFGTGARLRGMYKISADIGGKTGTTQNQSDGWFMGFSPFMVAGSWAGCEDRFVRFRSLEMGQGARTAMPIWALFFQKILADKSLNFNINERFIAPSKPSTIELDCSKYKQASSTQLKQKSSGSDFDKF